MANVILRDFRLNRDFRSVSWGATLLYNIERAAATGVVAGVLCLFFAHGANAPPVPWFVLPLVWPLMYVFVFLPTGLLLSALSRMVPGPFGLMSMFLALFAVAAGDPVLCIIKRFDPSVVPVDRPPLVSLNLTFYVLKAEESAQITLSH